MPATIMKIRAPADNTSNSQRKTNALIQGGKRANHLSKKKTGQTIFPLYSIDHPAGYYGAARQRPANHNHPGPSGRKNSTPYEDTEVSQEGLG